jgi:hypothetical protein
VQRENLAERAQEGARAKLSSRCPFDQHEFIIGQQSPRMASEELSRQFVEHLHGREARWFFPFQFALKETLRALPQCAVASSPSAHSLPP